MKTLLIFFLSVFALEALADSNCSKWESRPDYVKALEVVAHEAGWTYEEMCTFPRILDVETQPSRIILRDGTVVPHVRVQLHYDYHSSLYMINKETWQISESRCYSGM